MPLITIDAAEAVRIRKANSVSTWGVRTEDNRVEPVARPAFDTPFQLRPAEKIFTIGSCFARNVETHLVKRGYQIPMRDLFKTKAFLGFDTAIVNNFGTPSIYNELAWAFGVQDFIEQDAFVEIGKEKFVDLHMINSLRPCSLTTLRERRSGLLKATRSLSKCRVLIMTLGLIELWWDEQAKSYLNTAPMPSVLKRWPKRFSLHVLNFDESLNYLEKAIKLACQYGRKDLQILLTVSPVPMMATHRRTDVMTANCYSKSTLRSVAEHVAAAFGNVTYFPSYESVTLSDRRIAWVDDMVHVTPYIVELNVTRMINAFSGGSAEGEPELPPIDEVSHESDEALVLAEKAKSARIVMDANFFEENKSAAKISAAFALEYARFLSEDEQYETALAAIQSDDRYQADLLRAEIFLAIENYDAAIQTAEQLCEMNRKGQKQWMLLLRALTALGDSEKILSFEKKWLSSRPREKATILTQTGTALRSIGALDLAMDKLETAAGMTEATVYTTLVCAATMIEVGRPESARPLLDNVQGETQWQIKFAAALRERLPVQHTD